MIINTESIFKITDIDLRATEILLEDENKNPIVVDLRGEYLKQAEDWKIGDKLKATLTVARSRYTPDMVFIFQGQVDRMASKKRGRS